ncbi:hypothetical protein BMJ32_22550 [Sinorhizobium medicae]|nr:hypothetical protein BMJ32_22550 [Sinorhizobium medicae]PLU71519.1 hypothetical protein BMJ21_09860 [Sinorhizobium medicae]PLU82817.1 hypothetical protein BMJ22_09675 [Sinorhizobium medicae]
MFVENGLLSTKSCSNSRFYSYPSHASGATLKGPCPAIMSQTRRETNFFVGAKELYAWAELLRN